LVKLWLALEAQRNVYLVMITTSKLQKEQAHALNVIHQQYLRLFSLDVLAQTNTLAMVTVEQPCDAPYQM